MKKLLAIAFLLLFMPITTHAHSGLSSSAPAEGETLDESPAEIQFQFDTTIQQGDMTITADSGNSVTFSDVGFSETELIGQLAEELPNGAYTVDWSAISQDGHEITGTLTFNVAAEAVEEEAAADEEAAEDTTESTETSEEEAAETASETDEQVEGATASADQPAQTGVSLMTIIILAVLAIAAIAFFVMARRK